MNYMKLINLKPAFTLAEALITIGIIGIVAAIATPGVITKLKSNKLRAKLQKANTVLQQATTMMISDGLDIDETINQGNYQIIQSYFKNGECKIPTLNRYTNYSGTAPAGHAAKTRLLSPYCLSDGMVLLIGQIDSSSWVTNSIFAVDINGWENKPDKYGHDVFAWVYAPDRQMLVPLGENDYTTKNKFYGYFSKCPGGDWAEQGIACTDKALNDKNYFENLPK